MSDKYYYYLLNGNCRNLYDRLVDGIQKRSSEIRCIDLDITYSDVVTVNNAIELDNPELFYVDYSNSQYIQLIGTNNVEAVLIHYLYSVSDSDSLQKIVDSSCRKIVSLLSIDGCSELQKVWRVHELFIDNVRYFSETIAKKGTFEWHRAQSILGVFLDKKAVCGGISKSFKYVLNQIGVRSIVVEGTAISQTNSKEFHAWNIVKIDGNNYHVDMTWDITQSESGIRCYDYFNLKDELIYRDHNTESKLPKCISDKDNYFARNGFVIYNKSEWNKYFTDSYSRIIGDYYIRIEYPCDLESEIERIRKHIIHQANDAVSMKYTINNQQRIIHVIVQNE